MSREILIDTGPLVAIFSASDQRHKVCIDTLRDLKPPLITTLAVLTEASYLLKNSPDAIQKLLNSFSIGLFKLENLPPTALRWIAAFLKKYEDLNAQLADATLCYVVEARQITTVFTLDRRDFLVYRHGSDNRPYTLLPSM